MTQGLGQIERDLDRGGVALLLYEEAVAICREEGEGFALRTYRATVGDIHQEQGRQD